MDATITPATEGKGLARSPGALAGIKIIDLTRVLGGPYCTMILSDHGAEVIKIEPPQGDEVRDWGPPFHEGDASYFIGINRNKRSLALDIGKPQGKAVLLRLLQDADVLVENFKPGAMEKWGLGYAADLAPKFPGLIHCRISGFGADGPLGGLPGYDAILQAMTGLMSVNGDANTGPMRLGTAIVDMGTGLYSAIGILMALQERTHSGHGQYLDMTLYDCGMALLHPQAANFFLNGKRPAGTGNPHPNLVPYDKFPTRTCDIFIASGNNGQFRKLCEIIGRPDMAADPRFASNAERNHNRDALSEQLAAAFAGQDGNGLALRLIRGGVPAGPVLPVDQSTTAPHTLHREMVTELGWYRGLGTPIKLSRTPGGTRAAPPASANTARRCSPRTATPRRKSPSWSRKASCCASGATLSRVANDPPADLLPGSTGTAMDVTIAPTLAPSLAPGAPARERLRLRGRGVVPWAVFYPDWYAQTYPDAVGQTVTRGFHAVLLHYLDHGQKAGHSPTPYFDEAWYRATYPGVAAAIADGKIESRLRPLLPLGLSRPVAALAVR